MDKFLKSFICISVKRYVICLLVLLLCLYATVGEIIKGVEAVIYATSGVGALVSTLALRDKSQPLTLLNMISDGVCPFSFVIFAFSCSSPALCRAETCFVAAAVILMSYLSYWRQEERSVRKSLFAIKTVCSYIPLLPLIFLGE